MRNHNNNFADLFNELLTVRSQYEAMRSGGASFDQRAAMIDRLHTLRHDVGIARRALG